MTIEIYRAYRKDAPPYYPEDHHFSVVADENGAVYALPQEMADHMGFNQERINDLLGDAKRAGTPLPTTPLGWAQFITQDMWAWNIMLHPQEDTSEPITEIQEAVDFEISDAQDALEVRKQMESLEEETE